MLDDPIKLFLCGPMSDYLDFNRPAFNAAAAELRHRGYKVFNPAENSVSDDGEWESWMRQSIQLVALADVLVLLPGWMMSPGAQVEFRLAFNLGIEAMTIDEVLSGRCRAVAHAQPSP